MVHVEEVDLAALGIRLPTHRVGMVAMQPFLALTAAEPFRCQLDRRAAQLAALERTLTIAKAGDHGAGKTHFTLIPEYSIPGPDGIARIEGVLRDPTWPPGTIVIGGTDALSKTEYAALCAGADTFVDAERNGPDRVEASEWINCGLTWVKTEDGLLRRWLQPKLAPAWPEQNITHAHMFGGGSVFLFRCLFESGSPCRFFSLLCFDWIGIVDGHRIPGQVLTAIPPQEQEKSLSWVFVPEHNPSPSHAAFLTGVMDFFDEGNSPLVFRNRCAVVFGNTAGRETPGRAATNGCSGLILAPGSLYDLEGCHPTYSGRPKRLRGSDVLGTCKDTVFREKGACIHSFSQNLLLNPGAGGHSLPLYRANVHPIAPGLNDPRTPGSQVPASVKWVNDTLDEIPCLSQELQGAPLRGSIAPVHEANVAGTRVVESSRLERVIGCAAWRANDVAQPAADDWGAAEAAGLAHLIHTLDILGLGGTTVEFGGQVIQAQGTLRGNVMEVIAVTGPSHEDCLSHVERCVVMPARHRALVVTLDPHNSPRLKRDRSILRPDAAAGLGAESKITDARSAQIEIAFRELMDIYLAAATAAALEGALYGRLAS